MDQARSFGSALRTFLLAMVVLCGAYLAARAGFELTFLDSSLFNAESMAYRPGVDETNEFFRLHPDRAAGLFVGCAVIAALALASVRRSPGAFLAALAMLTVLQLVLRLAFAVAFGDASVIAPEMQENMTSAMDPDSFATFVVAIVAVLMGMAAFAVLQTTLGFSISSLSLWAYIVALSITAAVVGATVARRAKDPSRRQIGLGAVVACMVPVAYAGLRFSSVIVPIAAGLVLVPLVLLASRIGAAHALGKRTDREAKSVEAVALGLRD